MLISGGFSTNTKIGVEFNIDTDIHKLMNCFLIAEKFLDNITTLKEVSLYFNLIQSIFNILLYMLYNQNVYLKLL